jgi:mycothiol system anti-sigma-R factor
MTMTCDRVHESLSAYVDDELPMREAMELSAHLTECAQCSAAYDAMLALRKQIQEQLVTYRAPDELRARVRASLADAPRPSVRPTRALWRAAAAILLIVGGASAVLVGERWRVSSEEGGGVRSEVLASHLRSLMGEHLTDVTSTDQHTVKPWFAGKLDFSPPVPRLDDTGFRLLGGRLDYVGGRPVAALVYARREHRINVFCWPESPAAGEQAPQVVTERGYQLVHWSHGGLTRWAVSDLNAAELRELVTLLDRPPEPAPTH